MTVDDCSLRAEPVLRLRVITDGDPSVLPRLLGQLQNLNVAPRRVIAEFGPSTSTGTSSVAHVQIDISGLSEERVSLIVAKILQSPCVLDSYWHYIA
jgi:hypothetical protein